MIEFAAERRNWPKAAVVGAIFSRLFRQHELTSVPLTNQKGAVLELSGRQVGLQANVDLSGFAITLK
jgi:hypothetical protein